jgi:hypothetical protein
MHSLRDVVLRNEQRVLVGRDYRLMRKLAVGNSAQKQMPTSGAKKRTFTSSRTAPTANP